MRMHGLFLCLFIFTTSSLLSQESKINHYQKKCRVSEVILPCTFFKSNAFSISFPDSLYTSGNIEVKKLFIGEIKVKASFEFLQNKYTKVIYIIKKRKLKKFATKLSPNDYVITKEKVGRKIKVLISCNDK